MSLKLFVAAAMLAATSLAIAQEKTTPPPDNSVKTPVVNKRQVNQRARIRQGVKSGELTRGEAAKLRSEQRTIQAEKKMAKADGQVTPAERAKLRHDQNKASKDIYRKKHNEKTR